MLLLAQYTEENGIGLGKIFDKVKINAEDYSNVIEKIAKTSLGDVLDEDRLSVEKLSKAIGTSDSLIIGYAQTLKDTDGNIDLTTASTEGLSAYLEKSGNMFNFAAIKATLLNTALNAGIFLVASVAIQGIAKALDNYIHRVEKARERTDELFDEFKQMNDTLADHRKTVSELADRYDELSKGVNLSTNDNVSLSTEEYEEFLDINEQLAQSFPELAKGIDENGNSILTLGTKGITAKEQLEELLQTEEDLNNFRIAQGLEDAFKGVYTYVEDANEATEKLNGTISQTNEQIGVLHDYVENGIDLKKDNYLLFKGDITDKAKTSYAYSMQSAAQEFLNGLDDFRRTQLEQNIGGASGLFTMNEDELTGTFDFYANLYALTPEEISNLEALIRDNVETLNGTLLDQFSTQEQELQEQINKGENAWRDFIPNLVSGMKSKQTFKDLDSDLQDIAVQIVEGLDYSYATAMKEYDPDPYAYIRDKFIVPMGNLNDSDKQKLQSSFEELFKLDAENISQSNQAEIEKLITTIATLLEKDTLEIRVALGFDIEDVQDRYNEALKEAKRQLGGFKHDDRGFETNNSVGDKLDDFWNENVVTEEDWLLWEKVTAGINDATKAMDAYTEAKKNANAVDIDDTPVSLSVSDTIEQLNTQLKPAFDSLKSAYQDIFTDDGFTLENVDTSMLSSIKSAIDELNNMEDVDINIDYSSFENLAKVLTDTSSTADDVHEAMNSFATDIVNSLNPAISECDGESYKLLQTLLESMGIVNAEEVLMSQLGYSYEEYANAKEAAANSSINLNNSIDGVATALQEEGLMATEDAQQIMNYMLAKMSASGATIDVSSTIGQLAEEYDWLAELINQWGLYYSVSQKGHGNTKGSKNLGAGNYTPVQTEEKVKVKVDAEFDGSKLNRSAKSAGKDAGKSLKDALKEELSDLDSVISGITGKIDDQISSINEQKSAALDSIDAQKEALEDAKDAAVEALEAERDARLEVIETQKEQLEEQIKLIDKQIKAKQDEIKAIEDAASARQRELDLQRAQFELEKMQNMRTKLVK